MNNYRGFCYTTKIEHLPRCACFTHQQIFSRCRNDTASEKRHIYRAVKVTDTPIQHSKFKYQILYGVSRRRKQRNKTCAHTTQHTPASQERAMQRLHGLLLQLRRPRAPPPYSSARSQRPPPPSMGLPRRWQEHQLRGEAGGPIMMGGRPQDRLRARGAAAPAPATWGKTPIVRTEQTKRTEAFEAGRRACACERDCVLSPAKSERQFTTSGVCGHGSSSTFITEIRGEFHETRKM